MLTVNELIANLQQYVEGYGDTPALLGDLTNDADDWRTVADVVVNGERLIIRKDWRA